MKTALLAAIFLIATAAAAFALGRVSTEAALAFALVAAAWGPGLFLLAVDYRRSQWDTVQSLR